MLAFITPCSPQSGQRQASGREMTLPDKHCRYTWSHGKLFHPNCSIQTTDSVLHIRNRLFAMIMYLLGSLLLYHTVYDKRLLQHPRFLPNQIKLEINQGISAIPVMALLTVPFFLAEIRGWSKLYDFTSDSPFFGYTLLQYPLFICFTDSGIYWIHRGLHHPRVYRWLHKPHHKWAVPTPFASYAFHPLDGWSQSLPYHVYPLVFPLQKGAYLGLFIFVTVWTVLIRESVRPRETIEWLLTLFPQMTQSICRHQW